jgi:hypothetical protein
MTFYCLHSVLCSCLQDSQRERLTTSFPMHNVIYINLKGTFRRTIILFMPRSVYNQTRWQAASRTMRSMHVKVKDIGQFQQRNPTYIRVTELDKDFPHYYYHYFPETCNRLIQFRLMLSPNVPMQRPSYIHSSS